MSGVRLVQDVPADRHLLIRVPEWMGERVEVIIQKTAGGISLVPEADDCTQLQQAGGFLVKVLSSEAEDVWNEL
ncbi:hypothetical protein E4633_19825 [Geomonas terrae]|uniref:Uncharacterized protein n=1 Tax=Geomonas terrae TaxID=2562681 RepID=A0A4S1C9U5_9BACT|nr:hypothetical protein [Geomonas terrae]TGU70054.1 hypothetical protein E4633_19825 [Geomonas terrae]